MKLIKAAKSKMVKLARNKLALFSITGLLVLGVSLPVAAMQAHVALKYEGGHLHLVSTKQTAEENSTRENKVQPAESQSAQQAGQMDKEQPENPGDPRAANHDSASEVDAAPHKAAIPPATAKPGDVFNENKVKGVKQIYAGALRFSVSSVTVSISQNTSVPVVVTTSDGKAVPMPHTQWDDASGLVIGTDSANDIDGSYAKWNMIISAGGATVGTHQMRIVSYGEHGDNNDWEYTGYITVTVIK